MPESPICALPPKAKLETPDGPLTVASLARKPAPVLSRVPGKADETRFAAITALAPLPDPQPCVRVTLDNGRSFLAGATQSIVLADGSMAPAGSLSAGMRLAALFHYPAGYKYLDDEGRERVSDGAVGVAAVDSLPAQECWELRTRDGRPFAFSAGVFGAAAGS